MNNESPNSDSDKDHPEATTSHEVEQPKRSIQIGSQRDAADPNLKPTQPKAVQQAKENPVALVETPEEVVTEPVELKTNEGFSEDIDAEIEAAIGGVSMDSLMGGSSEEDDSLEDEEEDEEE